MGFTTASTLVNDLVEARNEMGLLNLHEKLVRLRLLIIDELGIRTAVENRAEPLFEIFNQKFE